MKYVMFEKIAEQLIERADKALGKKAEAQAFVARMQKECPTMWEYERALVCAYADGLLFGNWPWSPTTVDGWLKTKSVSEKASLRKALK